MAMWHHSRKEGQYEQSSDEVLHVIQMAKQSKKVIGISVHLVLL